jgi:hypothetical protein
MAAEMLKIRILLVEDEPLIRMLVAETLRDEGFEVIEASDADGAINELTQSTKFDVLLTDIRMPGKFDGLGVAALGPCIGPVYAADHRDRLCGRAYATVKGVWPPGPSPKEALSPGRGSGGDSEGAFREFRLSQIGGGVRQTAWYVKWAARWRSSSCSPAIKVVLRGNQDGCAGADRTLGAALP